MAAETPKDQGGTGTLTEPSIELGAHYDVVILGGGLAGLTLARHLLLETEKSVLMVDRRRHLPPKRQKVGESSVQLAGYYFARVLDLEELLQREHFMKYNLRFYWKASTGERFEDFSQTAIREFSNIPSYQIDRNRFEASLLELNDSHARFRLVHPARKLAIELDEDGPHSVAFEAGPKSHQLTADWVIDTTGRERLLARKLDLRQSSEIRHGASFLWVEGLVNIEKLGGSSRRQQRSNQQRRFSGHSPQWLATCHFMGEGFWFWVIPLQGKTSLGLVYDARVLEPGTVNSPTKLLDWVAREFPLFADDFAQRKVIDHGRIEDFAHGCARTIDSSRWGVSGDAGRFSDPLYSPGSDLIATYNTMLVDAIKTEDRALLAQKCRRSELLMTALYEAYLPSYSLSYDTLGDQEVFSIKYAWELSIYFGFYVFPFLNDLLTDRLGSLVYLRRFGQLGELNRRMQSFLSAYMQWKKVRPVVKGTDHSEQDLSPSYLDLMQFSTLRSAERTFYEVSVDANRAREILDQQLENLRNMAADIESWVASVVLGNPDIARGSDFSAPLRKTPATPLPSDLLCFDEAVFQRRWHQCSQQTDRDASPLSFLSYVSGRIGGLGSDGDRRSSRSK